MEFKYFKTVVGITLVLTFMIMFMKILSTANNQKQI
jgi:hypothetical protein